MILKNQQQMLNKKWHRYFWRTAPSDHSSWEYSCEDKNCADIADFLFADNVDSNSLGTDHTYKVT